MDRARLEVLRMVEQGTLSVEEGERLLTALNRQAGPSDRPQPPADPRPTADESAAGGEPDRVESGPPLWWQRVWIYPLVGGAVLLAAMGYLTNRVVERGTDLGWLACTVPLMGLGGLVAFLAWWSSQSRWLRLRVSGPENQIRLTLPLPIHPAAWLVRLARPWVPQFRDTALDELILSLSEVDDTEGILVVEVDEGEGESVQVFLG